MRNSFSFADNISAFAVDNFIFADYVSLLLLVDFRVQDPVCCPVQFSVQAPPQTIPVGLELLIVLPQCCTFLCFRLDCVKKGKLFGKDLCSALKGAKH